MLTRNRRAQLGHSRSNKEKTFRCTSRNDTKTWNYVYQYQNRYLPFRHWSRRTIATWQYYSGLVFSWFGVHDSEINKIMLPSMVEIVSAFMKPRDALLPSEILFIPGSVFSGVKNGHGNYITLNLLSCNTFLIATSSEDSHILAWYTTPNDPFPITFVSV